MPADYQYFLVASKRELPSTCMWKVFIQCTKLTSHNGSKMIRMMKMKVTGDRHSSEPHKRHIIPEHYGILWPYIALCSPSLTNVVRQAYWKSDYFSLIKKSSIKDFTTATLLLLLCKNALHYNAFLQCKMLYIGSYLGVVHHNWVDPYKTAPLYCLISTYCTVYK